jgi:hypothetical protein
VAPDRARRVCAWSAPTLRGYQGPLRMYHIRPCPVMVAHPTCDSLAIMSCCNCQGRMPYWARAWVRGPGRCGRGPPERSRQAQNGDRGGSDVHTPPPRLRRARAPRAL